MGVKPRPNPVHILSLGGGVQSTTIALMASVGEITPLPTLAIFADTGSESEATYRHLSDLSGKLAFPLQILQVGNLAEDSVQLRPSRHAGRFFVNSLIPAFFKAGDKRMMQNRRCTSNYKIRPIRKAVRPFFHRGVSQWIGISTDEAQRMKDSDVGYIVNRYPLIELGMSRTDCKQWLVDNGHNVPPKSSCVFCPFHNDAFWQSMKDEQPAEFQRAVLYERELQKAHYQAHGEDRTPYLHDSFQPLDKVTFSPVHRPDGFGNECSGHCGV